MSGDEQERIVTDDERWYDETISPELGRLGKLCQERGLPFMASVHWRDGEEWGSEATRFIPEYAPLAAIWSDFAARCGGNLDSLISAISREAKERGRDTSASLYFSVLFREIEP